MCKDVQELMAEEVHHIIDIDEDFSKRLDIINLLSVSKACHSRITMANNMKTKKKEINKYDQLTQHLIDITS
jgi:hypothetical protein